MARVSPTSRAGALVMENRRARKVTTTAPATAAVIARGPEMAHTGRAAAVAAASGSSGRSFRPRQTRAVCRPAMPAHSPSQIPADVAPPTTETTVIPTHRNPRRPWGRVDLGTTASGGGFWRGLGAGAGAGASAGAAAVAVAVAAAPLDRTGGAAEGGRGTGRADGTGMGSGAASGVGRVA